MEFFDLFILALIPLFVATDPFGIVPIFVSLTEGMDKVEKKKVLNLSLLTALIITVAFLFVGKAIFVALGITVADFQVAGGLVLLCIGILDILGGERINVDKESSSGVGVVPIGTPIIAGPAVLTTLIMLLDLYGLAVTTTALAAIFLLVWLNFTFADAIVKFLGENGTKGISKVISLLLCAIAVMMIRRGIEGFMAAAAAA